MIKKETLLGKLLLAMAIVWSMPTLAQDPPDISLVFYLEEHSPNGTLVGTVTGTDPNGDPLIYSIASGNGSGAFSINSTTGDVLVADESQMNFDQNPSFLLGVEANDGNGGITTVEITINLIDIPLGFENPEVNIAIYPNPASDLLKVDLKKVDIESMEIELHSLGGHRVSVPITKNESIIEIDLKTLQNGVYFLSIVFENDIHAVRRILVR